MAESPSEEEVDVTEPPMELRCKRSDGKRWRCHGWRIHEQFYCQKHYLQILARKTSSASRSNSTVAKKRPEGNAKSSGVALNKSKKLGLFSGGKKQKKRRGREGEASSSEDVLPNKKPRSKRMNVEEVDSEETEEEEMMNVVKSGKRGGKNESLMKKKKIERDGESDEEVGNLVKRAKRSGKFLLDMKKKKNVLRDENSYEEERDNVVKNSKRGAEIGLGRKKKKIVRNDQSDEDEEERDNVIKSGEWSGKVEERKKKDTYWSETTSHEEDGGRDNVEKGGKRCSKVELGRKKKNIEDSEETEEEDEDRRRDLIRAKKSGGVNVGKPKRKLARNKRSVDEGGMHCAVKGGKRSGQVQQGKKKKKKETDWSALSDEEEGKKADVKKGGKEGGRLDMGKKKEKLEREGSDHEEEERSVVKSAEATDDKEGSDGSSDQDDVEKNVEISDEMRLGKTRKKVLRTEGYDKEEEEGGGNLKENNGVNLVKMIKSTGLTTKMVEVGMKSMQNEEENFENGGSEDTVKEGGKKKSKLRGNTEEVGKGKVEGDNEDGDDVNGSEEKPQLQGKRNKVGKGEVEGNHGDGDNVDDSEDMDDDCLIKFAKKDFKPQTFSKREDKKFWEKKGGLPNISKVKKEEKASEEDAVDDENVDSVFRQTKKGKRTLKIDSQSGERRRKGPKMENMEEAKEEEVDHTDESDAGAYIFRERSSRTKKSHKPKVDLRRKHFSTDDPEDDCQMCHQCMYSNKRVVRCRKERDLKAYHRRYCELCIRRWYPQLSEEEIAEACPYCRGNCNCKACLRKDTIHNRTVYSGTPENEVEKIHHFKYLVSMLAPVLKQFDHDQMMEKETEAKIRGLMPSDIEIERIKCFPDERLNCDCCGTSIIDFHRSCPNCSYDLCLTCCREIREGCLQGGNKEFFIQYVDLGKEYLHGKLHVPSKQESASVSRSESASKEGSLPEWKAKETGEIPCPPKERGGCGYEHLELKCIFAECDIREIRKKVEILIETHGLVNYCQTSDQCPCFKYNGDVDIGDRQLKKAASRKNSDDNYIYFPSASKLQQEGLEHFQRHWIRGEPVIVSNALELTSGLSWEPMVMRRAVRDILVKKGSSDLLVTAVDCLDWCEASPF